MGEMLNDDLTLLREYARRNSEDAFATLVSRHVSLVYSVALRQVQDPHLAEEITQAVFIILARKAASFGPTTIVSGWLCRTARYASANALKVRRRRQHREQEAYMQSILNESEPDAWGQIAPLLDGAMEQLRQKDHDAVVLRFFEGRNFKEVGAALGASEDAAKMRVNRALEKLRKFFIKHGVASTTVIIAGAISANSVQAAPVALAKTVTAVAVAKGAAASGSTLTLIKGALKLMAWTKAKTAIVAGSVVILTATVGTPTYIHFHRRSDLTSSTMIGSSADYPKTADQAAKAIVETLFVKGDINEFYDKFGDPNPILRKVFIESFLRAAGGRTHPMPGAQVVVGKPENSPGSNIWLVPFKTRLKGGSVKEGRILIERNSESNRWIFKSVS